MKFTKENVFGLFGSYRRNQSGMFRIGDLEKAIMDLDDTPEKAEVPKFVADVFSGELHFEYEIQESRNIPHVLSTAFGEVSSNKNIKFLQWVKQYPDKYVMAVKYGYEVEKEPRYEVIIAGRNLLKLFHGRIDHEFAEKTELCAWAKAAYQLTEQEIKAIDERYWPFAVPAND